MEAGNAHEDIVNGDIHGEDEIGELKLDEDVLNPSPGYADEDIQFDNGDDYLNNRGNSEVLAPVGGISSGGGLGTQLKGANPVEREMSIDDEITMETTDPITEEEDPGSYASEIESVLRDVKFGESTRYSSAGIGGQRKNDLMDTTRKGASSSYGGSHRSGGVNDVMDTYLSRTRTRDPTDPYELYLDIPQIPTLEDSESEEDADYEFDYNNASGSDQGVNDLLAALQNQIKWKEDRNLRKARGDLDEPRNSVIRRYNPEYEPPPDYVRRPASSIPKVPPPTTTSTYESKYQRRNSIDTSSDYTSRYRSPTLSKKFSSSYDNLPRYVSSSTASSASSGYSSLGRYGSVDSLSPSRSKRYGGSEEPSSYLSGSSYSTGLRYRSHSSSDVSRTTPSYKSRFASTYDYGADSESESESDNERPYYSPLAPHRAYRAYREGRKVAGPFSRHLNRFSTPTTTASPTTTRRSASPPRSSSHPADGIDERLRLIRENYRKTHKLDFERNVPQTYSSYAGLGVDSEGGSALSMESSDDERIVSRVSQRPVDSRNQSKKPFFSLPLRRKTVYVGEPARISCNVQGTPKPRISWTRNGIPIYDGQRFSITYRWGVAMVELLHTRREDTGTYVCTAKNNEGETSSNCELLVEDRLPPDESEDYIRPSFAKPLRRVRAKVGRKVRMEVQVMGWPEPKVTWLKNGLELLTTDKTYVEKFPNGIQTLVIYKVKPGDAGRYQAIASSPAGKASCSADVDVIEVPFPGDSGSEYDSSSGRGRHKTRRAHRPHGTHLDVDTHRYGRSTRESPSLSPTPSYKSSASRRKDHYTPKTDVLAPSRGRSFSPTSPTGYSPSHRFTHDFPSYRTASPSTYRPSSPVKSYRPSSPSLYRSPSPTKPYRPMSPSSPYSSYHTTKQLTSRRDVSDSGVEYYQARSTRPSRFLDTDRSTRYTRESGLGYLDTTSTSASFTRTGSRTSQLSSYSGSGLYDRHSSPTTRSALSDRPSYREPYTSSRDRPVAGPTKVPRRVYQEDYFSMHDDTRSYDIEDRYSREYGSYEASDEELPIRTYAPSAPGVGPDEVEPEIAKITDGGAQEQKEQPGAPKVIRKFGDLSVRDGERVVLEVELVGSRPMDVGWLRNGQDIVDCKEFKYVSRGNIYQLEIAEIFPEDSGKYTCEALNDLGEAECSAILTVNEEPSVSISQSMDVSLTSDIPCTATIDEDHIPPEFFEEPQSLMVESGTPARFTCDVDGDPVPSVAWSRDDKPFSDGGRFSVRSDKFTHTFEILSTTSADAGTYKCEAKNSEGEVICEFTLDVLPSGTEERGITASDVSGAAKDSAPSAALAPPKTGESETDSQAGTSPEFVQKLQDEVAWEEEKVDLICQVKGVPTPTTKWYARDTLIENDKFVFSSIDEDGVCKLTISEAFPEDAGTYKCQATNSAGSATTSADLIVAAKIVVPKKLPGKPKVEQVSGSSVKLSWQAPPEDGGSRIFNYKIDTRKVGESKWKEVGNVNGLTFEVTDLPSGKCEFRVSAENEAGTSPPTDISDPVVIKA